MTDASSTLVFSVRVDSAERALLEAAAAGARTTVDDFVRRASIEAAELEALNRSTVVIPAEDWNDFEAWITGPAEPVSLRLADLARRVPTWER